MIDRKAKNRIRNAITRLAFWAGVAAFAILAVSPADAAEPLVDGLELAALVRPDAYKRPDAPPQGPSYALGRFEVSAACDGDVTAFKVTSQDKRWPERGELKIVDATTGVLVRARALVFKTDQSAGFRIPANAVPSAQYGVVIVDMSGGVAYEKSFVGRCVAPLKNTQTASR